MSLVTNKTIKVPEKAPKITLQDLETGAMFRLPNNNVVYVKSDEIFGRGYRCMNFRTGELTGIDRTQEIGEVYKSANIVLK